MIDAAASRLAASPGLGRAELAQLQRSRVALLGLGVLGGQTAIHLGLLGIGVQLLDDSFVGFENLGNQAFRVADVGALKSLARARHIAALNPDAWLRALACRVEDLGLAALEAVDVVATGLDSALSRVRVNELVWRTARSWVDSAVDGSGRRLHGTVTVFDARRDDCACWLCRYDARALDAMRREGRGPGCANPLRPQVPVSAPTLQASAFAAVVAGLQAVVVTRLLLGRGEELVGRQIIVECDAEPRVRVVALARNPRCLFDHQRFALSAAAGDAVGDVLDQAAAALGAPPESLALHGRSIVSGLVCSRCGVSRDVVRAAGTFRDGEVRCSCNPEAEMVPRALSDGLSAGEARRLAAWTWDELGIPAHDVVTARAGTASRHYVVNQRAPFSTWTADAAGGANHA